MGPKFLSAGLLVLDAGLLVISDSISFVSCPVRHTNTPVMCPISVLLCFFRKEKKTGLALHWPTSYLTYQGWESQRLCASCISCCSHGLPTSGQESVPCWKRSTSPLNIQCKGQLAISPVGGHKTRKKKELIKFCPRSFAEVVHAWLSLTKGGIFTAFLNLFCELIKGKHVITCSHSVLFNMWSGRRMWKNMNDLDL